MNQSIIFPFVLFPDGTRVEMAQIASYAASGSDVVVTFSAGGTYTYAAGSSGNAVGIVQSIDKALKNGFVFWQLSPSAT